MATQTVQIDINSRASGTGMQQTASGLSSLKSGIESVGAKLIVFNSAFEAALGKFREMFQAFNTSEAIHMADSIGKAAQKFGLTAEALSKLTSVAKMNDLEIEKLQAGYKGFIKWQQEAGISSKGFSEDLIEQAGIFASMPDGMGKSALAVERFGKAGLDMIPLLNVGSERMKSMMEKSEALGVVTEKQAKTAENYDDAIKALNISMQSLAREIATITLAGKTKFIDSLTGMMISARRFVELNPWVVDLTKSFSKLAIEMGAIGALIAFWPQIIAGVTMAFTELNAAILGLAMAGLAFKEGFKWWESLKKEEETTKNLADANNKLAESILSVIEARRKNGELSAAQAELYNSQVKQALRTPNPSAALSGIAGSMRPEAQEKSNKLTRESYELQKKILQFNFSKLELDRQLAEAKTGDPVKDLEKEIKLKEKLLAIDEKQASILIQRSTLDSQASEFLTDDEKRQNELRSKSESNRMMIQQANDQNLANPESFKDQFRKVRKDIEAEWGTWAKQMASTFANVFNSAISSISNGITGLIMGTMTWGQALMSIANTILTTIIQSIVQMGVRWVMTQIMMAVAGKSIMAASVAATAPIAMTQAAIWATPAYFASVATLGAADAAGLAALQAGQSLAIAGGLLGGAFAEGGVVHGGQQVIQVNERGQEAVLNAGATSALGEDVINRLNRGAFDPSTLKAAISGTMPAMAMAGALSDQGNTNVFNRLSSGMVALGNIGPRVASNLSTQSIFTSNTMDVQNETRSGSESIHILLVDSRNSQAAKDFLASSEGRARIVEIARDNKQEIGIR